MEDNTTTGVEESSEEVIKGSLKEVKEKVEAMKGEGVHGNPHFKLDESKGEISKRVEIEVEQN